MPSTLPSLPPNLCFADALNDVMVNFICGFNISTINVSGFIVVSMLCCYGALSISNRANFQM